MDVDEFIKRIVARRDEAYKNFDLIEGSDFWLGVADGLETAMLILRGVIK